MAKRKCESKRAQEARAAEMVKALVGDAEAQNALFQDELGRLIDDGAVSVLFDARHLRNDVFENWLRVQGETDPERAFIELCGAWYERLKRETPAQVSLIEELVQRFKVVDRDDAEEREMARLVREAMEHFVAPQRNKDSIVTEQRVIRARPGSLKAVVLQLQYCVDTDIFDDFYVDMMKNILAVMKSNAA
jgi:hypothetical protein